MPAQPLPAAVAGADAFIDVTDKRRIIAQRLAESKYSAPHYYLRIIAAMDSLLEARKRLNAAGSSKVSLNAFLTIGAENRLHGHAAVSDLDDFRAQFQRRVHGRSLEVGDRELDGRVVDLLAFAHLATFTPIGRRNRGEHAMAIDKRGGHSPIQ